MQEPIVSLDLARWLPIGLAAVSLLISAYTLWRTQLLGPRLRLLQTGRLEFSRDPQSPGAARPMLGVSLLVTNYGASVGYLTDVAASVRSVDGSTKPVLFRSVYEQLDERLNFKEGSPPPPEWVAFRTFAVAPRSTVLKRVALIPVDGQAPFSFQVGAYSVTVHSTSGRGRWKGWQPQLVHLDPADVKAMEPEVRLLAGGRQFVNLRVHSKPTNEADKALAALLKHVAE